MSENKYQAVAYEDRAATAYRAARQYADDPARAGLLRIEIVASVGSRLCHCHVGIRVQELGPGAREALEAGLRTTDRRDDAAIITYRTGRTRGEVAAALRASMTPEVREVYGTSYPPDACADPEIAEHHWCAAWYPARETPEQYLSRQLQYLEGRIVRAGL